MTRLRVVLAVRRRCARGSPHSVGTRPRNWHMSCGVSATSTCSTDSTPARPCPGFTSARNPQRRESVKSDRRDDARKALPRLLRPHWRKLRRRVRKAGPTPSDSQLHKIRIASKQLRYGAELAKPVLGKAARRTAHRLLEDIQTILGDHHDAVSAIEWLEQIPADSTTGVSFVAGGKAADARRHQLESRQQWEHAWERLNSGTVTGWLQ